MGSSLKIQIHQDLVFQFRAPTGHVYITSTAVLRLLLRSKACPLAPTQHPLVFWLMPSESHPQEFSLRCAPGSGTMCTQRCSNSNNATFFSLCCTWTAAGSGACFSMVDLGALQIWHKSALRETKNGN